MRSSEKSVIRDKDGGQKDKELVSDWYFRQSRAVLSQRRGFVIVRKKILEQIDSAKDD